MKKREGYGECKVRIVRDGNRNEAVDSEDDLSSWKMSNVDEVERDSE